MIDGVQQNLSGSILTGKVALVTGASRGIGKAIAIRLARDGATIAVHYALNELAARETVAEIKRGGADGFIVGADLRTLDGVSRLFSELDEELLRRTGSTAIDILVNNAGIAPHGGLEDTDEALFDEIFSLNVKAPFFIVQKALPRIRDHGRIINLSSCLTRFAYPVEAAYSLSKGAIDVFSLLLAKQLGSRGITVNALAPGVIDTDMNAYMLGNPEGRAFAASLSVFNRVGMPSDVADIAAFLASPDSRWLTGQYVDATGGTLV
jgi:3-oxoacyl-[acyl-carrier protein] reductase